MTVKVTIPNTFATATTAIPLSQLDANFSNVNAAINSALTYSNYAADTGAADNYSVTLSGITTTYTAGLYIQFKAANTNTGASTLNVNAQGAKSIVLTDGSALPAGAILIGAIVTVMYDGTNFQLLNDSSGAGETFSNVTVTGTITDNNINVSGLANIAGGLKTNALTGYLYGNGNSGNVTASTTIPNAGLANSNVVIGNTTATLGTTVTSIGNLSVDNLTINSVSTPVTVTQGGTGLANLTANNVVLGNNTSTVQLVSPGTTGNVLTSDGTTWKSQAISSAAVTISNDTSTNTSIFPLFANVTTGTATQIFTSNAYATYLPSTGELTSKEVVASNGIFVNKANVSANYTIAAGYNGLSAGAITVDSNVTVTVSSGSVWTVV